jgi:DHA1 family inner membrane transport protein
VAGGLLAAAGLLFTLSRRPKVELAPTAC